MSGYLSKRGGTSLKPYRWQWMDGNVSRKPHRGRIALVLHKKRA